MTPSDGGTLTATLYLHGSHPCAIILIEGALAFGLPRTRTLTWKM